MKKLFLTFLFYTVSTFYIYSQSAYYDAINLKHAIIDHEIIITDDSSNRKILERYVNIENPTEVMILNTFSDNPYFSLAGVTKSFKGPINVENVLGNIGSLDVTNFADGMAKFLVDRTKQELSVAFFKKFEEDIKSNDEIKILFPTTSKVLEVVGEEIYNYSVYLDLLRESFQKDLALLLPNIGKLIDNKCMDELFKECPELRIILSDAFYIANQFSEGTNPGEIFHNYTTEKANIDSLKRINPNIYPSLQVLDLFSQSLRSKQPDKYWISQDSLKLLFDQTTFQIYIGLIFQQAQNSNIKIVFKDNSNRDTSFVGILKEAKNQIDRIKPYLTELISKGKSIDYYFSVIKEKQKLGKDKPSYQDYYSLYDASLNFLEYIANVPSSVPFPILKKDIALDEYFSIARSFGNIYVDVYEKQYTSAIVEISSVFTSQIDPRINSMEKEIKSIEEKLKEATAELKVKLESDKNKLESKIKTLKKFQNTGLQILKYGNFIALVAKAENSDEVQKAIEAVALPAGSSRVKRESAFNVSLNAYVGFYGGNEYIKGTKNSPFFNSYGITAPIGIAASLGGLKPCSFRNGHSLSLFVSVIDLGALAAYRFMDDSTSSAPKVELKNIISPGAFLSWGFGGTPLSVSVGYQMGPILRKVSPTINTFSDNKYGRLSITITVDIPLLNFYTKPKESL